jgi:D-alanyl-D-alanine carboxypeptidase
MDDLAGHVFGKTGFIGGVRALSGYIKTRDGKWLAFSVIFNKLPVDVHSGRRCADNVCRILVEYPNIENAKLREIRPATTQAAD